MNIIELKPSNYNWKAKSQWLFELWIPSDFNKKYPVWDKRGMVVAKESDTYKCLNIQEYRFSMWFLALKQCGFIVLDFIVNDPWSR